MWICIKSTHGIKLFLEKYVLRYFGLKTAFLKIITIFRWKVRFLKFFPFFVAKGVLHQIELWKTTLSWKLCLDPLWVHKSVLPSFHHFSLKNAFCIKPSHAIKLFLENCVLLHCGLKTAFFKIFTISPWKKRFASNPLMDYNSFLKTVFLHCVLKAAFSQIFTISRWKMCLSSNPLTE